MSTYFSVGEVSKLYNISIQALRYYDKIGLLRPAYINKETNYRYYSMDQFIKLDLLKQCKMMKLSLEEIKEFMEKDITRESIINVMKKQKISLENKIRELEEIKDYVNFIEEKISETYDRELGEIFIKEYEERKAVNYNYISTNVEEIEMNLRKIYLEREKKFNTIGSEIIFKTSYNEIKDNNKLIYNTIMIYCENNTLLKYDNIAVIPAGKYLCIYVDESYTNIALVYEKLLAYIEENQIQAEGDFYETAIMPRVDKNGREKTLTKIEILIK